MRDIRFRMQLADRRIVRGRPNNGIDPRRLGHPCMFHRVINGDAAVLADLTGIQLDPAYPTTYGVKALALNGMGRSTDALAAIDRAITLDPENAHYWHMKGTILSASGNCADAKEALDRSLALDPSYTLPYPGFTGAHENLITLNSTCTPAAVPATAVPSSTKSPAGAGIAVGGLIGALFIAGMRK